METKGTGDKSLLLFQLGPVQDFIAQARSTRDLWSGSYMISWLVAHAIREVVIQDGLKDADVVLPSLDRGSNPLVLALRDPKADIFLAKALIPNLPNRCLIIVPKGREKELAGVARKAVSEELAKMGGAVWLWLRNHGAKQEWKQRWDEQIRAFPQFTYAWTPWAADEEWKAAYDEVNKQLAARRNTRDFAQWQGASFHKDSLSGKEESIGDTAFWDKLHKENKLFKTPGHSYGAINLIKRLWVRVDDAGGGDEVNYLDHALNYFPKDDVLEKLRVRSVPEIAKDNDTPNQKDNGKSNNKYVAILSFDGDHMGARVKASSVTPKKLRAFSAQLSSFALDKVPGIVLAHKGHLIYVGGDDVLAILPSTKAIACAKALHEAFKEALKDDAEAFKTALGGDAEASCGIAVGHENAPLQSLVEEARKMERRAKDRYDRAAVAIGLYKRSGEIIEWGTKWSSGALELMDEVRDLTNDGRLSGRFPYALAELLKPYELKGANADMESVIMAEVKHVLSHQGAKLPPGSTLINDIEKYLNSTKDHLEDFINLFLAETFIDRNRGEE